ncbi:MAG: RluA family pseudouridine synthase [Sedimentisphaerales bacterium]|nr:RluA family pseudouridine synthase [Sedimentisphaerales bacterium]HNY77582.1 RluA family pseudouridine synthase [Sedimentisphaerales bacterium]HOC61915.1 RluA family pseudouridine synthase [Sedimentisphaerales bacterium]HOH63757.1 RluA family pseudouridine synthase [Sedimentisphaerales bacterium]HPY51540.1 RluA family pseudouridine synthase [Sedimentisphaerales bacterium]
MATISLLYEDDDILAVDKPEGLAAIPERHRGGGSLFELLCAERREKLYIVHRIDKETSGLIVFARHAEAHRRLNRLFETRAIDKTYLALVQGVIAGDDGVIDRPLRQFGSGRVAVDLERGKPSATEFRVAERFRSQTLVEARPRTGRRHQIRVHLYSLGHPIAGDPVYGDEATRQGFARMMLHAWRLGLTLLSSRQLTLEAPIPESFQAGLRIATAGQ